MPDKPAPREGGEASKVKRLEQFRIYYNHTIHPELMRMEQRRLRLLRLFLFSGIILAGIILVDFYFNNTVLTLFLAIPIGGYIFYLLYRIQEFRQAFKPNIMNLILDFIDDGMNFDPNHPLEYFPKRKIDKAQFLQSQIFATDAPFYEGEDFINGRIGEMNFEMCELAVKEFSPVRNRLNDVFNGVFLHATFPEETYGRVIIWPRRFRQHLTRAIKNFTWESGKNVDHEVNNDAFREAFLTYATEDTHVEGILSEPMQDAIVQYRIQTGKEIYMSFINRKIYAAVTEDKDLLEPYLFRSNLSFELVREFFEDINLLLRIAEDFDQTH
ncbi:MAG: DUF3137 domain-containing protein [Phaeodactylibacter sp.]|nr:DUF3137 domain-containing protein [Phaeodactylibacter sp.]MCB9302510.1 DUF3137 domain-containing protein [Lewinellaceae bacterium]HQU57561.1 DUF3137 domain-containing protein [Saprospiraceae bacterium]